MMPHIGDVVLIIENMRRGSWKLGKIIDLIIGSDGQVRSAKVRLASKTILHRALNQLCPLECSIDEEVPLKEEPSIQIEKILPLRQAAVKAKENLKKCFK